MEIIDSDQFQLISSVMMNQEFRNARPDNDIYYRFGQHIKRLVILLIFILLTSLLLEPTLLYPQQLTI